MEASIELRALVEAFVERCSSLERFETMRVKANSHEDGVVWNEGDC